MWNWEIVLREDVGDLCCIKDKKKNKEESGVFWEG